MSVKERIVILFIDDAEIEDHPYTIHLRNELLCDILRAYNGPEGIKLACQRQPDLILLDLVMPNMDGFEVCLQLKSKPALADIPVIILTKKVAGGADEQRAYQVGADDFLHKPVKLDKLVERVSKLLKRSK